MFNSKTAYKKQNSKSRVAVILSILLSVKTVKKGVTKNISVVSPNIKYLRSSSSLNTSNPWKLKAGAVVETI